MRKISAALVVVFIAASGCTPAWLLPSRLTRHVLADGPLKKPVPAVSLEVATPPRKPLNVLALSGGGSYGAYTAGILNGWTRSNKRPDFDVVTGISTGALIAPLAFLGPKHDDNLRRFYTEIGQADVLRVRVWATIPFRDSVALGTPLRAMIEANLTAEVFGEIAKEHAKGRRLYVATTNLETRRSVVWDLGAIASRNTDASRTLIRDVILASCSIPGVFPPVSLAVEVNGESKRELHVDGGVNGPVFVPPGVFEKAADAEAGAANLYVIIAGKFYPSEAKVQPRVLKVLGASGGAVIHSQIRRDVANLYHMAQLHGVNFHVSALRQDFLAHDNGIQFHPKEMHRLYVEGVRVGFDGDWDATPPERSPGETPDIRTGTKLKTADPPE
jgi:predicted acylesterase/phospholipase RssA